MDEHDCTGALRDEVERRTAFAVGLSTGHLSPEEQRFLQPDVPVDAYLTASEQLLTRLTTTLNRYAIMS